MEDWSEPKDKGKETAGAVPGEVTLGLDWEEGGWRRQTPGQVGCPVTCSVALGSAALPVAGGCVKASGMEGPPGGLIGILHSN